MRTTLSIDDDILMMAKSMAERQRKSIGEVLSDLARQALRRQAPPAALRNGVRLLPMFAIPNPVTMEQINQLRDELA